MARGRPKASTVKNNKQKVETMSEIASSSRPGRRRSSRKPNNDQPLESNLDLVALGAATAGIITSCDNGLTSSCNVGNGDTPGLEIAILPNMLPIYHMDQDPIPCSSGTQRLNDELPGPMPDNVLPGNHLVLVEEKGNKKCQLQKLLDEKYDFPREFESYSRGSRVYATLDEAALQRLKRIGARNLAVWRNVISQTELADVADDFDALERERQNHVKLLARTISQSNKMRFMLEENSITLNNKVRYLEAEVQELQRQLVTLGRALDEERTKNLADQKTNEQKMFHDKKFNESVEESKKKLKARVRDLTQTVKMRNSMIKKLRKELKDARSEKRKNIESDDDLISVNENDELPTFRGVAGDDVQVCGNSASLVLDSDSRRLPLPTAGTSKSFITSKDSTEIIRPPEMETMDETPFAEMVDNNSSLSDTDSDDDIALEVVKAESPKSSVGLSVIQDDLALSDDSESEEEDNVAVTRNANKAEVTPTTPTITASRKNKMTNVNRKKKPVVTIKKSKSKTRKQKLISGKTEKQWLEIAAECHEEEKKKLSKNKNSPSSTTPKKSSKNVSSIKISPPTCVSLTAASDPKKIVSPERPPKQAKQTRQSRIKEKIGDPTIPVRVVASCDKFKQSKQIELALEKKRNSKSSNIQNGQNSNEPVQQESRRGRPRSMNRRSVVKPNSIENETPIAVASCSQALDLHQNNYDSPLSPPLAVASESAISIIQTSSTNIATNMENLARASALLSAYFVGRSSEELKERLPDMFQSVLKESTFDLRLLAQAMIQLATDELVQRISKDKPQKGKKKAKLVDNQDLRERYSIFCKFLDSALSKGDLSRVRAELYIRLAFQKVFFPEKTWQHGDDIYRELGTWYGYILHESKQWSLGETTEFVSDLIFSCLYWKPNHGFSFAFGILLQHADAFSTIQLLMDIHSFGLCLKMVMYVLHRTKRYAGPDGNKLKNLLSKSLSQGDLFLGISWPQFAEAVLDEWKEIESDEMIKKIQKHFGMLCIHADWTCFVTFVRAKIPELFRDWSEDRLTSAVFAAFVSVIGDVANDYFEAGDVSGLIEVVAGLKAEREGETVLQDAVTDCLLKLEFRREEQKAKALYNPPQKPKRGRPRKINMKRKQSDSAQPLDGNLKQENLLGNFEQPPMPKKPKRTYNKKNKPQLEQPLNLIKRVPSTTSTFEPGELPAKGNPGRRRNRNRNRKNAKFVDDF